MKYDYKENLVIFMERLESLSFYFFLVVMTLSWRKIIYMHQIRSSFNEYTSIYIYLSDIALILVFLLCILNNKNKLLSNIKFVYFQLGKFLVKHFDKKNITVPRGTIIIKKTYAQVVNKYWLIFPLVAVLFSFSSILWTTYWKIALFRSIKLLEFASLYFYVALIVSRGTIKKNQALFHVEQLERKNDLESKNDIICSTWNKFVRAFNIVPRGTVLYNSLLIIVITGVVHSIVAIFQFILQKSTGLLWLKESIISPEIPGVAKVVLSENVLIRAYGLFPHPNILGGYLVLSITLTVYFIKLFHVEQFKIDKSGKKIYEKISGWNSNIKQLFIVPRGTIMYLVLFIQIFALLLSFSKSALLGLIMGLLYLKNIEKVPRGTFSIKSFIKLFHVEQFNKMLFFLVVSLGFLILIRPNYDSLFIKTLLERNFYINVSRGTFMEHPLWGVGAGQFVFQIEKIAKNVENWQFQPVHNVFLLILNEYGLFIFVGFLFFLGFIYKRSKNNNINKENSDVLNTYFRAVLLSYIFIMIFDHYFWDIQQGNIMLWLLLGMLI